MLRILFFLPSLLLFQPAFAQFKVSFGDITARNIGPAVMSGRISDVEGVNNFVDTNNQSADIVVSCEILTSFASLLRHSSTKSLKFLLKFPLSFGGSFFGIRNNTLIGCSSEQGGSPCASSIAVIPSDQISACNNKSYIKSLTYDASQSCLPSTIKASVCL